MNKPPSANPPETSVAAEDSLLTEMVDDLARRLRLPGEAGTVALWSPADHAITGFTGLKRLAEKEIHSPDGPSHSSSWVRGRYCLQLSEDLRGDDRPPYPIAGGDCLKLSGPSQEVAAKEGSQQPFLGRQPGMLRLYRQRGEALWDFVGRMEAEIREHAPQVLIKEAKELENVAIDF